MNHVFSRSFFVSVLITAVLVCAGCPSGGDVTVPQSDATPPTISLQVAVQGSNSTTAVSTGGSDATLKLSSRAIKLNITATAKDADSGVQDVEIWVANAQSFTCPAPPASCSMPSQSSASSPMWSSTSAQVPPGGKAVSSSILSESFDPVTGGGGLLHPTLQAPPGGTVTEKFDIWVVAKNELGGKAQSPSVTVLFRMP